MNAETFPANRFTKLHVYLRVANWRAMMGQGTFGRRDEWAAVQLELHLSAKLAMAHSTHSGVIESLCTSGATLRFSGQPRIGANGYLGFADHSLYCSVAWINGERCGVLFERLLTARHMQELTWISRNHDAYDRSQLTQEARTWR